MMENFPTTAPSIDDVIATAIADLVHVRSWGAARHISLPFFYPSGSNVVVKVEPSMTGFWVTDNGLAYREIDNVGGDRYFSANIRKFTDPIAAWHDGKALMVEVQADELAAAIADIASASSRLAWKIMSKIDRLSQGEVIDHLYERLDRVFGASKVERVVTIVGPSTHPWEVDALVHSEGREAVFQAVSNHHASVYSTSAMFRDLDLLDRPVANVAVVRRKTDFGYLLSILSQAGNVIEEAQADSTYQEAFSWAR